MKQVVEKLLKKVVPKKTDDLLELDSKFEPVISIAAPKQPWLALAREAYRFVKSGK